jgi:ankyrin repeat protein
MYIYLIDNKVYLTIPIIAGSDIATDNTCKTFKVLEKYIDNVQTELDFFGNLFELLGDKYTSQRAQIQQYKNIVESLHQQGAFNGLHADDFNSAVLKEFLDQSNSMVLDPQTNRDNFLKSSNPTFSLQHERFSGQGVTKSILGVKFREAITNIKSIKLDTPSIDNFKEALPDININDEAPLERCKEAWLQAGFTERQWTDAGGALEERINQMLTIKEEDDEIFDKDQLCGALDSVWPIITQNQVSFNSLANDIFKGSSRREVKIDKIAVLNQFFLGNLNIYLKDLDRETINLGQIFDSSEELSSSLANAVQESLTQGDNAADTIINFLEINGLCPELSKEQKEEAKKLFINRYITIKGSDHFDEFFVLPKDTNSPWFYYGGAFSLEITKFASKFQVTKDKFKDFIDSINFNEVAREDDNSLPNINFIDHFDLDNKDIILNQNNFNILERLTNTTYKPTRYIYDKITSKIKIDDIDSNIAQKILNIAISKNNIELLKAAANKGANLDIKDEDDQTPLIWAISKNNPEIALALINKGADLDIKDKDGHTPLHWATSTNNPEIAFTLIENGANPDIQDSKGHTPLYLAILHGNNDLVNALIDSSNNINICREDGVTPLHVAAKKENNEIIATLIEKGANIDIQDNYGETPLHYAVSGNKETVATLIQNGADINIRAKNGQAPLHVAALGNNETVATLIENGADIDIQDEMGHTPLLLAIIKNKFDNVLYLIEKGADISIKSIWDHNPIQAAISFGFIEIAYVLIDNGINLDEEITFAGESPLAYAIWHNRTEIVLALINKGADVNKKDKYGESPLDLAYRSSNTDKDLIIKALIDNGAEVYNKNKIALLVISIFTGIATISLLIIAILLPPLSIILFGCATAAGLSSIISLNYYFKAPEYIVINKPSLQPLNKNETKKGNMKTLNGENKEKDQELSSVNNNPPQ